MIDIGKIIKRAWHILWNYKMLWIFGILLALVAGGGNSGGNSGSGYQFNNEDLNRPMHPGEMPDWVDEFNAWFEETAVPTISNPEQYIPTLIWIGVGVFLFILIISVIATIIRYVTESAIIRMVDEYEQSGTKLSFKAGWKLGWTRRAFRMWVIDLVISLPALLVVAIVVLMGLLIFTSLESGSEAAAISSLVFGIGCTFIFIFAIILLSVVLGLLRHFFVRVAVLEEAGIGDSFRRGWAMFKANWKNAALMWLVMLGIGIGFGIAGFIAFFLLIPVYAVMLLPGAVVAAIPGLIAVGIVSLFVSAPWNWIIAAVVALPFLLTVAFLPLSLINGGYMVYESNIWTLTYRELKALAIKEPAEEAPASADA